MTDLAGNQRATRGTFDYGCINFGREIGAHPGLNAPSLPRILHVLATKRYDFPAQDSRLHIQLSGAFSP